MGLTQSFCLISQIEISSYPCCHSENAFQLSLIFSISSQMLVSLSANCMMFCFHFTWNVHSASCVWSSDTKTLGPFDHSWLCIRAFAVCLLVGRSAGLTFPRMCDHEDKLVSIWTLVTLFVTNDFHLCAELQIHCEVILFYLAFLSLQWDDQVVSQSWSSQGFPWAPDAALLFIFYLFFGSSLLFLLLVF